MKNYTCQCMCMTDADGKITSPCGLHAQWQREVTRYGNKEEVKRILIQMLQHIIDEIKRE